MLVLSRKKGQTVMIGEGIEIEVVEVRGRRVRLAIRAPKTVPIHRLESMRRYVDLAGVDNASQSAHQ